MQPETVSVRVKGGTGVRLTRGDRSQASGSRSPPLEERVGERRPFTLLGVEVRGDIPAGCRANTSGRWAQNDDLLSLPLSSKGGEGNGTGAREHRDACKEQCKLPARSPSAEPSGKDARPAVADILLVSLHKGSKTAHMEKGPVRLSPGNQNVL
jgi:hypothetical protein